MIDGLVFGEVVNRTARLMRRLADARLGRFGLSSGYLPVVTALMQEDGLTQKALVMRAAIEQPTMVNTLGRMERDGIIERRADPTDRRSVRISLAPSARVRLSDVAAAIRALNDEAVAGLTVEERTLLLQALLDVTEQVDAILRKN